MTWNIRRVKHLHPKGDYWACHEVFYDDVGMPDGITAGTGDGPFGASEEELAESFNYYREAMSRPYLVFDDVTERFVDRS